MEMEPASVTLRITGRPAKCAKTRISLDRSATKVGELHVRFRITLLDFLMNKLLISKYNFDLE